MKWLYVGMFLLFSGSVFLGFDIAKSDAFDVVIDGIIILCGILTLIIDRKRL